MRLLSQRAAIFGMDARIALVALAVAAGSIGLVGFNHVQQNRINLTLDRMNQIRDALISILGNGILYSNAPADMTALAAQPFMGGALDRAVSRGSASTTGVWTQDFWNNSFILNRVTVAKTINNESVNVYYYTLHSPGPNGTNNSATITTEANWQAWAPVGDDLGIKFTTYDQAVALMDKVRRDLQAIIQALQTYERNQFEAIRTFCDNPLNQLNTNCDHNNNGVYVTDEEFQINLYPRSSLDASTAKFYVTTTYTSGNLTSMFNLLTLLGVSNPTTMIYDSFNRTLRYHSNAAGLPNGPFTAQVWYQ